MSGKVPKYFFFRIYLLAIMLYLLLVLPMGSILSLKHGPEWMRTQGQPLLTDTTIQQDTSASFGMMNISRSADTTRDGRIVFGQSSETNNDSLFSKSLQNINRGLILSLLLGFIYNLPFKRYFRRKRKGKRINPKLRNFCRRQLLKTPRNNALILGGIFLVLHGIMLYLLLSIEDNSRESLERTLFTQFFYISLTASILVILFLFFWQQHRVRLRYIEHLYTNEELRKRIGRKQFFRIRNRMLVTSGMTTLLPLAIVTFYLFLSLTTFDELGIKDIENDQAEILFGKYLSVFSDLPRAEFTANFFYVNAIDSILMFVGIFTGILISFIYIIFFVRWNTEDIVSPVKQLLGNMEKTGEGELEQYTIVRTGDEVGQLAEGYNRMSVRLKNYFDNIRGLTETYSRFVPRQFLDILGKESYTDIRLGDQVEREMTVLFSDIRSFTTLSESMTPKENFDFINKYLGIMEPVIRKHRGFIDKYIGDAIMALFPEQPDDAVKAAIAMREELEVFNALPDKGVKGNIDCGIGIHTGRLMLGIVGAEDRMDGTVISDAVNLAARLEGLTKSYSSSVILSEETLSRMHDPGIIHVRYLDHTKVKGKLREVTIYEVVDAEPVALKEKKLQALPRYEQALRLIGNQKFKEASALLTAFLDSIPEDPAALALVELCQQGSSQQT